MKTPEWQQRVLLFTSDNEINSEMASIFGLETELITVDESQKAIDELNKSAFHVLIIDAKTSDPKLKYFDDKKGISFLEVSQYAGQLNQKLTTVVLVNKLQAQAGDFARKCGANVIMDRKHISKNILLYMIREMRKRTFRTLLRSELAIGQTYSEDIYHFLPLNGRYAVFLTKETPLSSEKMLKLEQAHVRHVYVREQDLDSILKSIGTTAQTQLLSAQLAILREHYKQILMQIFDVSTDSNPAEGKSIFEQLQKLVSDLSTLLEKFSSPLDCISQIPYPRWSGIAHAINCGIYAILFCKQCGLEPADEIAIASIIHNIGLAEVNQTLLDKHESEMNFEELEEYKSHTRKGIEILKRKRIPYTPMIESILLHHHENFDGTGYPDCWAGVNLPNEIAVVSILAGYDYCNSMRVGEKAISPIEAWQKLLEYHTTSTKLGKKFTPELLEKISPIFTQN